MILNKSTQHALVSQYYEQTYSDESYKILCDRYEFPEHLITELRRLLEDFAAIWRWHRARAESVHQPSRDAKAIALLEKQSQKLQRALDALSDHAFIEMRQTNSRYEMQYLDVDKEVSDIGHEGIVRGKSVEVGRVAE